MFMDNICILNTIVHHLNGIIRNTNFIYEKKKNKKKKKTKTTTIIKKTGYFYFDSIINTFLTTNLVSGWLWTSVV